MVRIRPATPDDIPALARVQVDSWRTTYAGLIDPDYLDALSYADKEANWRRMFAQPDVGTRRFAVVADDGGLVRGFAMAGPNRMADGGDAELFAIYLLADAQGQGLGRRLFTTVAQRLHEAGFQSLIVWVLDGNPAARFYERMGGRRQAEKTLMIGLQTCPEIGYVWSDLSRFE